MNRMDDNCILAMKKTLLFDQMPAKNNKLGPMNKKGK